MITRPPAKVVRPLFRVAEELFNYSEARSHGPAKGEEGGGAAAAPAADGGTTVLSTYAVLLLNAPSKIHFPFFAPLWRGAAVTICADGGATRLHRAFGTEFVPTLIGGDFDSSDDQIREDFARHGTQILPLPDQSKNDFEKCLELIHEQKYWVGASEDRNSSACDDSIREVYVFGGLDGRLDHTFANIGVMHKYSGEFDKGFYLVSGHSIATLIEPGSTEIHAYGALEGPTCGLLPSAGAASSVTTVGLKWDIKDTEIALGRYVNSSNAFAEDDTLQPLHSSSTEDDVTWAAKADKHVVHVQTTHPLLWTTEIKS